MNRVEKIKALKQIMNGGSIEKFLMDNAISIPSWIVNEHDADIEKLKITYPDSTIVQKDGKFYSIDNNVAPKIFKWFENETV